MPVFVDDRNDSDGDCGCFTITLLPNPLPPTTPPTTPPPPPPPPTSCRPLTAPERIVTSLAPLLPLIPLVLVS